MDCYAGRYFLGAFEREGAIENLLGTVGAQSRISRSLVVGRCFRSKLFPDLGQAVLTCFDLGPEQKVPRRW